MSTDQLLAGAWLEEATNLQDGVGRQRAPGSLESGFEALNVQDRNTVTTAACVR